MDDRGRRATARVVKLEGGWSNDPRDPGGATKYGITLRYLRSLGPYATAEGYDVADLDHDGDVDVDDIRRMTPEIAAAIYYEKWWLRYGYDKVLADELAFRILDLSILCGPVAAAKMIQRAVNDVAGRDTLVVDGKLGPASIGRINATPTGILVQFHKKEAIRFFRGLDKECFLQGWINRVNAPIE